MEKQNLILDKLNRIEKFMMLSKKNLTVEEAALYLGLSVSYIYKLCYQGKLSYSKPNGKKSYFSKESLDAYMEQNPSFSEHEIEQEALRRAM